MGENVQMTSALHYPRHRFPIDIVSQCVWLYFRFSLSYRDVEVLMAERGVNLSYATVRSWCDKFGREYAKRLKKRTGDSGDTWHLDEVYLKVGGKLQYLWRAVDQEGRVIDILVQSRRNTEAARRFFRKLLKSEPCEPRQIVTDRLGSYAGALRGLLNGVRHVRDKGANNRAENSHQPTREHERRRRRFRSACEARRFLSTFSPICNHFRQSRHTLKAENHRLVMARRFAQWREICALAA